MRKVKICKLTKEQNRIWVKAFQFYKDKDYSDLKADKLAFRSLIKEFPKLRKCDKII